MTHHPLQFFFSHWHGPISVEFRRTNGEYCTLSWQKFCHLQDEFFSTLRIIGLSYIDFFQQGSRISKAPVLRSHDSEYTPEISIPKMMVWKMTFLFKDVLFRFHISFRRGVHSWCDFLLSWLESGSFFRFFQFAVHLQRFVALWKRTGPWFGVMSWISILIFIYICMYIHIWCLPQCA